MSALLTLPLPRLRRDSFCVPPLLVNLNLRGCFVFAATSFPCAIASWFFLPETKGRAAAEIDELFEKKVPAWRWAKFETEIEQQTRAAIAADHGDINKPIVDDA